ncbi:MAG TPA: CBS domain-containing protein [Aquabacterium sp.]|uniref:CBS domain-containing protein n=1 Tax=Aquabacterium sp. TaxID=1872578 RepID=UPI002E33022C|nr:CBS domain-containing protein [Aquabacterium sp.]HEX5373195.1 CBS domain-containing protein [Aquabacterium sp.]
MNLSSIVNRTVAVALPHTSVTQAAKLMREYHIGALVVMSSDQPDALPRGMLTDRDLVLEVLAQEVDPDMVTVGDISLERLVTASVDDSLFEAVSRMSEAGVRRLVIVDEVGGLIGLVSMDDVIVALSQALVALAQIIPSELRAERRERPGLDEGAEAGSAWRA